MYPVFLKLDSQQGPKVSICLLHIDDHYLQMFSCKPKVMFRSSVTHKTTSIVYFVSYETKLFSFLQYFESSVVYISVY